MRDDSREECTFSVAPRIAGFAPDRNMGRQNRSRHNHNMDCWLYLFSADSRALHPSDFWPTVHTHMMLDHHRNPRRLLRSSYQNTKEGHLRGQMSVRLPTTLRSVAGRAPSTGRSGQAQVS